MLGQKRERLQLSKKKWLALLLLGDLCGSSLCSAVTRQSQVGQGGANGAKKTNCPEGQNPTIASDTVGFQCTSLSMLVSFNTCAMCLLAPASRNSPPAPFTCPADMTMIPIPVLSMWVTPLKSKMIFFCCFSRTRLSVAHSSCLHSRPMVILPVISSTTMSGGNCLV